MSKQDKIKIVDTYDKEGFWIKRTIDNVPVFVPKQEVPSVAILDKNVEWITEKFYMSPAEHKIYLTTLNKQ